MLSYIYRIAQVFMHHNGYRPNVLYINDEHFQHLCEELDHIQNLDQLTRLLGMEVILSGEAIHPGVAWSSLSRAASA